MMQQPRLGAGVARLVYRFFQANYSKGHECLDGRRNHGNGKRNLSALGSRGLEALGLRQRRARQQAAETLTVLAGMQRMKAWPCVRDG